MARFPKGLPDARFHPSMKTARFGLTETDLTKERCRVLAPQLGALAAWLSADVQLDRPGRQLQTTSLSKPLGAARFYFGFVRLYGGSPLGTPVPRDKLCLEQLCDPELLVLFCAFMAWRRSRETCLVVLNLAKRAAAFLHTNPTSPKPACNPPATGFTTWVARLYTQMTHHIPSRSRPSAIDYVTQVTSSAQRLVAMVLEEAARAMTEHQRSGKRPSHLAAVAVQDATIAALICGTPDLPPPVRLYIVR